jgi:alpha-beta hydrolase superfamily lysophospholipase
MIRVLVLIALVGCAHSPDLAVRPDPALPAGSTAAVETAPDGTQLYTRHWATAAEPKAVVVIMHGLKDYAGHYETFATRLTAAGYGVYAFDLRGHGRSAGPRVAPARWLDYVDDLDRFLAEVAQKEPGKKIFLFGHSMGGAIATLSAIRHRAELAGLILSGPALEVDAVPLLLAATRMAGALTPGAKALDLANEDFSSDPAVVKAMTADPLIEQDPGPARTAAGLIDGMRLIWAHTDGLTLPILALHGTRDALTAPSGSRALIDAAPSTDKTLRIYEGFYHDLLHEPKRKLVEDDILAWLDAHTGGDPVKPVNPYVGRLRGDPVGWTQAIELGGGIAKGIAFAGTASIQLARPRPLGWHGGITAQWAGDYKAVSLRPLGVAVRFGGGVIGVDIGASVITGAHLAISGGGWLELPLGPVHVGGLVIRERGITNTGAHGPLSADLFWTSLSARFGGDRTYWPGARAGVGPVISGGLTWVGAAPAGWFTTLGLQLYGAD